MEIFEQNEFIINGKGKIIYDHYQADIDFQIEYYPNNVLLKTSKVDKGILFAFNYGKFEGIISDTNQKVKCKSICLTKHEKYKLIFVLLEDLVIGDIKNCQSFKARLFGLTFDLKEFKVGKYIVSTKRLENTENVPTLIRKFGGNFETSEMSLEKFESDTISKENTIETSKEICLLLSFILSKKISFNRCEFSDGNNQFQKIIRIKENNNSSGESFLFDNNIEDILSTLYDNYKNLSPNEQKCLFTAVEYLNSTSQKYLEDSILSIAQVWEILSDTFLLEKVHNTNSIKILRDSLKSTIKDWHQVNSVKDYDLNFIQTRVLGSLDWEKVIRKLEKLSDKENLDLQKIKLNFKELIILRNQITHTGRFKEIGKETEHLETYSSATLGIKILILKKLGYSGSITFYSGGIPNKQNIYYYIKNSV